MNTSRMQNSPLRWGILSTARINRALIPPLRVSPRNVLNGVASRDPERARAYASEWNIPKAYPSYDALINDPEIDVVYNPLPNHLHAEWTVRAVRAGKHVLCEKPLALSLDEVDAIIQEADRCQRVVAEAFMYRHHPQTLHVKELVEHRAIGSLQLVRGSFSFQISLPDDIRLISEMGGGSIWDVGCYPINYARWIIGEEPDTAFGWQATGKGGVDEYFTGQLKFPGDRFAQFDSGFRSPHRVQMEIVGSEGSLLIPNPFKPGENETIFLRTDRGIKEIRVPGQELYIGEVEDMADSILSGSAPRISLADSRGNVDAIQALLKSARLGTPVRI